MKKIIAGLSAFVLALSMAGCGEASKDNDSKKQEDTSSGTEVVKAEDSSESEAADVSSEDEDDSSKKNEDIPEEKIDGKFDTDNIILHCSNFVEYEPDVAEVYDIISLAVEQYEYARDEKPTEYMDTINFKGLTGADKFPQVLDENWVVATFTDILIEYYAGSYYADDLTDAVYANDFDKYIEAIRKSAEEFKGEPTAKFLGDEAFIYGAFWHRSTEMTDAFYSKRSDFFIDESSIFFAEIDGCERSGKDLFISMTIYVLCGDYAYGFETIGWRLGGETGVLLSEPKSEENIFKGQTADEVRNYTSVKNDLKTANINAKYAFNAAAQYLAEMEASDRRGFAQVISDGDFGAMSADGLDMSGSTPEEAGAKAVYDYLRNNGVTRGIVYIGCAEIDDRESFFIHFKKDNSSEMIGQYPYAVSSEDAGNVGWTEYFNSRR